MDAETARIMNVTLMGLALVGSGLAVLYESRSQTSYRRTARWAERTGLPLLDDADPLWPSIAASMRRTGIAEALSLVAAAAVSLALVATGLGSDPMFVIAVFMPLVIVITLGVTLALGLREHLFSPAAGAPRVARARSMRAVDYVGPARRIVMWALVAGGLAVLAALIVTWVRMPARVDAGVGRAALVVGAVALIVTAALPHMERSIVSHAQPASSALQLAWDDALRGGVLSTACLAVATLWLIVVLLTGQALWGAALEGASAPTPMSVAGLAMVALSQVFPTQGFALRARLRPRGAVTA